MAQGVVLHEQEKMTKIQDLEHALEEKDDKRVLNLIMEIVAMKAGLPSNLIIRTIKYIIKQRNPNGISHSLQTNYPAPEHPSIRQLICYQIFNIKREEQNELLREAIAAGDATIAMLLLQPAAYMNECTPINPSTLLHEVLTNFWLQDNEELAQFMLHHGADPNACDEKGHSALRTAIRFCSSQMVGELLNYGAHINALDPIPDQYHGSVLNLAIKLQKKDSVKLLLDYGADPDQKNENGQTPLYQTMRLRDHTSALRLIQKGANINAQNEDGRYPIHGACETNFGKNILLMLDFGADLNVVDRKGRTPFDNFISLILPEIINPNNSEYTLDNFRNCAYIIIKHLALQVSKHGKINERDKNNIQQNRYTSYYDECLKELQTMKTTNICNGVSYYSLFTNGIDEMLEIMENPTFAFNFKRDREFLSELFPSYCNMLLHLFAIAETRSKLSYTEPLRIQSAFENILPDLIIEIIAYYSRLIALEQCERDYYVSYHA